MVASGWLVHTPDLSKEKGVKKLHKGPAAGQHPKVWTKFPQR